MRKMKDRLDLTKAFAAPPESFVQRTRATLDQLEEAEQVKKTAYGTIIAIACVLILMTTGLAAGISGLPLLDNVSGRPDVLSQGVGGVDMWRENDEGVQLTFDRVVFSGEYLYLEMTHTNADDGRDRMDYMMSVTVNGAEPELVFGNVTAGGENSVYECVYRCAPAASASVRVGLGDDKSGRSFNTTAEADKDSIERYHIAQSADDAMPALTEGYALIGEDFGVVSLRWEPANADDMEWAADVASQYRVMTYGLPQAYIGVHREGDALLARALFRDEVPGEFGVRFADDQLAHYELQFREDSTYSPGGVQEVYMLEAQRDGNLLHVSIRVSEGASGEWPVVTLNGAAVRTLAGMTEYAHLTNGDEIPCTYDMLLYCDDDQHGPLRASVGELYMTMKEVNELEGRMKFYSVEYVGAGEVQPVNGWAVNAPDLGVACGVYMSEDEAELHRIADALEPMEIGGRTVNYGTRLFERDGMHGLEITVYSAHGMLPEEFTLGAGLNFRLTEADRSVVDNYVYWMDMEKAAPALSLSDVVYDGEYLMVSYEVSFAGVPLYAGEGIDTEYAGQPVDGADGVQMTSDMTAADGTPLERVYASARYTGEGRDSMVVYELYECAMGDEANAALSVGVGTHGVSAAVTAPLDDASLTDITKLNAQTFAYSDYVSVYDARAYALDKDLILNVTYAPAEGEVFGDDGVNSVTLYGAADSNATAVNYDEHGEAVSLTWAGVYYGMADAGTVELYVEAPGSDGQGQVLVHMARPARLIVQETGAEGGYAYALVEIAQEGGSVTYDHTLDYMGTALASAAESFNAGEMTEDEFNGLMESVSRLRLQHIARKALDQADAAAIGGADGPTAVIVSELQPASPAEDEAIAIIGGADGPTSIYVTSLQPTPAPVEYEGGDVSIGIIGSADGPTSIHVTSVRPTPAPVAAKYSCGTPDQPDAAESGGIDLGYSFVDNSAVNAAYVISPRMLSGGEDVTLAVADVSDAFEHGEGAAVLMIVGRAGDDMEVRCILEDEELSAALEDVRNDAEGVSRVLGYAGVQAGDVTVTDAQVTPIGGKGMALLEVAYTVEGEQAPFGRMDVITGGEGTTAVTLGRDGAVLAAASRPLLVYYEVDGVCHSDRDCAGDDFDLIPAQEALDIDLTPCDRCVDAGLPVIYGAADSRLCVFAEDDGEGGVEYRAYQLIADGDVTLHVTNGLGAHAELNMD